VGSFVVSYFLGSEAFMRGLARRLFIHGVRSASTLATEPGRTLRISGLTSRLVVKTNMETYLATVEASAGGKDLDVGGWGTTSGVGDLRVEAACEPGDDGVTTVSIPASFNVEVDMAGSCDVDMSGWLEGTVSVAVSQGSIAVNTVRGLRTRLCTGQGDVRVQHIEGNLDVSAGLGTLGNVDLGKVMGEEVNIETSGKLRCRALYAKDLCVWATGGVDVSVLESERAGVLALGDSGSSTLGSCSGNLGVILAGKSDLQLQLSDALRSLWVKGGPSTAAVAVHLPESLVMNVSIRAAEIELDPRLAPEQQRSKHTQGGPTEWGGTLGVRKGPPTRSLRQDRHSSLADSAATASGPDLAPAGTFPSADGKLDLDIPNGRVRLDVRSWFDQMKEAADLGAKAERRPQPYR
jgi:hypothetical protein